MNSSRTKIALIAAIGILVIAAGAFGAYSYLTFDDPGDAELSDSPAEARDSANDGKDTPGKASNENSERGKAGDSPKRPRSNPGGKADPDESDGIDRDRFEARKKALQERDSRADTDEEAEEAEESGGDEDEDLARPNDSDDDAEYAEDADRARIEAEKQDAREASEAQKRQKEKAKPQEQKDWKSAVLQIVTNFEKAEVTVNGLPYPQYLEPGEPEGMTLPAGGPYDVRVTYDGKTKAYRVNLRPNETRLLMVELTGFQGGGNAPPSRQNPNPPSKKEPEEKEEEKEEQGKVTVYSKPVGTIIIGGNETSEKTPGTVDVENGRHEVQVEYDHGEMSEKKIIRVRQGSRIKLFFRARNAPE